MLLWKVIYYCIEKTTVVQSNTDIWKGKVLQKQANIDESVQVRVAFTSPLVVLEAISTNPVSNFLVLLSADNQEFHNK